MKKLIVIMLLVCSCTKAKEKVSDEVVITVLNQCTATIYFYDANGDQYTKDIFDCEYVSVLRIKVAPGTYTVKAETSQGKTVTKTFTKSVYAETLDIEF
jgi:hypothetical protein